MSLYTPRVLPAHLHAFHPSSGSSTHTVRILGTVTALHGDTATITCGNNGDVTLILKSDSHLQMGKLVEVVGKVTELEGGQVRVANRGRESGQQELMMRNRASGSVSWPRRTGVILRIAVSVFPCTPRQLRISCWEAKQASG